MNLSAEDKLSLACYHAFEIYLLVALCEKAGEIENVHPRGIPKYALLEEEI